MGVPWAQPAQTPSTATSTRDIDTIMRRTSRRPLARPTATTIKPPEALAFGIALGAAATILLDILVNWLAAAPRRRSHLVLRLHIHPRAEAQDRRQHRHRRGGRLLPVLVGWSAVTGSVAIPAIIMSAVVSAS
jgi:heme o synthase